MPLLGDKDVKVESKIWTYAVLDTKHSIIT